VEQICAKSECYGCGACYNICPTGAIRMVPDEEGFLYPKIDQSKCTDCGKCKSVCQVYHDSPLEENFNQRYFAVKHSDKIRKTSSSGGLFTALSDYFLENEGFIVGAGYDDNFKVVHKLVSDEKGRNSLRGSKYVQSDMKDIYLKVGDLLDGGNLVLFTGTPCQVEGLNLFLQKDYKNLTTVDLVCHGVGSPKVFDSFLKYIQEKAGDKLVNYNFRDKKLGWRGYNVSAEYKNKKVTSKLWLKSFNYLFSKNIINRPSCNTCKHFSYNRFSDITIGDYWGVEKYYPDFEDSLGVSLLMINTAKGKKLYKQIKDDLTQRKIRKEESKQNSLIRQPKKSKVRDEFWNYFRNRGYKVAIKKHGNYNYKGFIQDILRRIVIHNPFISKLYRKFR